MENLTRWVALAAFFLLVGGSPAHAVLGAEASITAQNTFTDSFDMIARHRASLSISGTFVATVTLQRKCDGTNWRDVEAWTGEVETTYLSDERCPIRLGVKTGDFTSGTAVLRIGFGG